MKQPDQEVYPHRGRPRGPPLRPTPLPPLRVFTLMSTIPVCVTSATRVYLAGAVQGDNGVEAGGAYGGVETEDDTDACRDGEGQEV